MRVERDGGLFKLELGFDVDSALFGRGFCELENGCEGGFAGGVVGVADVEGCGDFAGDDVGCAG